MLSSLCVLAAAAPPTRILTFGDSLTAGLVVGRSTMGWKSVYAPYSKSFAALGDINVCTEGMVMESSHDMPARLDVVLARAQAPFGCCVILGGSNDLWRGDVSASKNSLADPVTHCST